MRSEGRVIRYAEPTIGKEEIAAVAACLRKNELSLGRRSDEFCTKFSDYLGVHSTLLVNSGSSANLLALAAMKQVYGIQDVVLPAVLFPTSLSAALMNGLKPVIIDVDAGTYNMSLERLEQVMPALRKPCIFVQHTLGNPVDMFKVRAMAAEYGALIIEDFCDALGSELNDQRVGVFGELSTCSFYPAHTITMGEGGSISLREDDEPLYRKLISLRDWGRDCHCTRDSGANGACGNRFAYEVESGLTYDHRYVYTSLGYSMRPTEFQAAMGLEQLKRLDWIVERRRENYEYLTKRLGELGDMLQLPHMVYGANPCWFAYPITLSDTFSGTREDFLRYLESNGIQTRVMLAGNVTRQPVFKQYRNNLVNADRIMRRSFFVGVHQNLDESDLDYVADAFLEYARAERCKF